MTGHLRKADETSSSEYAQTANLFSEIWGAGAETAKRWFNLGLRTLDDLRTNPKAKLTRQQQIGLAHYDVRKPGPTLLLLSHHFRTFACAFRGPKLNRSPLACRRR